MKRIHYLSVCVCVCVVQVSARSTFRITLLFHIVDFPLSLHIYFYISRIY